MIEPVARKVKTLRRSENGSTVGYRHRYPIGPGVVIHGAADAGSFGTLFWQSL